MNSKNHLLFLLLIVALASCTNPKGKDARQDLLNTFKDQKIEGFNFETSETDTLTKAAFKNRSVGKELIISANDTSAVLGYFTEKNSAGKATSYRTELIKRGSDIYFEVTDPDKNVLDKISLPPVDQKPGDSILTPGGFNSINDCIADFNCNRRPALLCEANRTCRPVFAAIICCLTNGQCFSIHFIINPTNPRCWLRPYDFPDIAVLAK